MCFKLYKPDKSNIVPSLNATPKLFSPSTVFWLNVNVSTFGQLVNVKLYRFDVVALYGAISSKLISVKLLKLSKVNDSILEQYDRSI